MTGFEELTVSSTVLSLDSEKYKHGREKSQRATISIESDQVRYRVDGGNPTTTVGHLANAADIIELESHNEIKFFRVIRVTTDAGLKASYQ